jgi:hypothetical protein
VSWAWWRVWRCLVNPAVVLAKQGRRKEARSLLKQSLELAQDHGYEALIWHINRVKRALWP